MRLTLTTDDGEVLDTLTITAADFTAAQADPSGAQAVLGELTPGPDPDRTVELDDADDDTGLVEMWPNHLTDDDPAVWCRWSLTAYTGDPRRCPRDCRNSGPTD